MKAILLVAATLFSVSGWAMSALPNGNWTGTTEARDQAGNRTTSNDTTLAIQNNVLTASYMEKGQMVTRKSELKFDKNDFLSATEEGTNKTLTGYCGTSWCHLEGSDNNFEMTLAFTADSVDILGSALENNVRTMWESHLTKVVH